MAKKTLTELPLEKLIPMYGKDKAVLDEYKKSTDSTNKRIKELMVEQNITEKEAGGYLVKYSVSSSKSYNMDALLDYLHRHKEFEPCIKTQEYVDEDVLENLIYTGKIPKNKVAALKKFTVVKDTPKLTIKKVKEN